MAHSLRILPIGGLGEIGMNCMMLEWEQQRILIDCGLQFPDASFPGTDVLLPDFSYLRDDLRKLKAIVVTHGHEDHIGAIPFLAMETQLDIFCTAFPQGLLEQKLSEFPKHKDIRFRRIKPRKKFRIGPFTFDPIPVAHSIVEALAFAIGTPVGVIVHTGDFKDDPQAGKERTGLQPFRDLGKKGVRLLLSDSTNAERDGHTISEAEIEKSFKKLLAKQRSRVFIALFASNIRRIENLLRLLSKMRKKVAFLGRSMHSYTRLAHELSLMDIPENTLIPIENIQEVAPDKVVVLLTGSQAEPRSALLRIARGEHPAVQLRSGDLVMMSSRFIPGNERAISQMIDQLYRNGAEVLYESFHQIHVSGHGFQEELTKMLRAVQPECFIPIHGEYRHMKKHAALAFQSGVAAENILVIENGQSVDLTADRIAIGPKVEVRKIPVSERTVLEITEQVQQQRLALAKTGVAIAVIVRDRDSLRLLQSPTVHLYGLLFHQKTDEEKLKRRLIEYLEEQYEQFAEERDLEERLRLALRRFIRNHASHKPASFAFVLDV